VTDTTISAQNSPFGWGIASHDGNRIVDQIGRDDQRSSDTGLAFVVSRWLGRSVGAWDPA